MRPTSGCHFKCPLIYGGWVSDALEANILDLNNMDYCAAINNEIKQRIKTLQPCCLNTIWTKVKGDDDYCMSTVMGYSSDSDLINISHIVT